MNASDRRIIFLGSKAAGYRICNRLAEMLPKGVLAAIICPDDRNDPRGIFHEFESLAARLAVPFHVSARSSDTIDLIRKYTPSTIMVHGWYQIIPVELFPQVQFFGFHYSPLPRYRGNAPLVWQILQGEQEIGVSLFELVTEMDAGRLYAQELAPLGRHETISDALAKANNIAENMIGSFVTDWLSNRFVLRPQPDTEPSYCGLRTPEDGHIDWSSPGIRIHNFVRAQSQPYPGAFCYLPDQRRLTIWKTEYEPRNFMGVPGAVAEIQPAYVVVTAGSGAVRILEVQIENEQPSPATHILRSLKLRLS